jgi:hypothetical protein
LFFRLLRLLPAPLRAIRKRVSSEELVEEFQNSQSFYEQFDLAEKMVRMRDTSVLKQLEPYLVDADRHVRGNAAFVFASLGDERGFDAIRSILQDRSSQRPMRTDGGFRHLQPENTHPAVQELSSCPSPHSGATCL